MRINEIRDFYAHMALTHERLGAASQCAFVVIPEISHSDELRIAMGNLDEDEMISYHC